MYCSYCFFFTDLGRCKNPKVRNADVGYFQKAGPCFTEKKPEKETPVMAKITSETKVCADCGRELPIEMFQKTRSGGTANYCKDCMNKRRGGQNKVEEEKPEPEVQQVPEKTEEPKPTKKRNYLHYVTDDALVAELKRRGYTGSLTKTSSFEL